MAASAEVFPCNKPFKGWLLKRKGSGASGRYLKILGDTNRRFFTLDFAGGLFYYGHTDSGRQVSMPIATRDLRAVDFMQDGRIGFIVTYASRQPETMGRMELLASSTTEAVEWVAALSAAMEQSIAARSPANASSSTLQMPEAVDLRDRLSGVDEEASDGDASTAAPSTSSTSLQLDEATPGGALRAAAMDDAFVCNDGPCLLTD
jgi:hypothetical protein